MDTNPLPNFNSNVQKQNSNKATFLQMQFQLQAILPVCHQGDQFQPHKSATYCKLCRVYSSESQTSPGPKIHFTKVINDLINHSIYICRCYMPK